MKSSLFLAFSSIDTANTGTGDHENYFVQLDLNNYLTTNNGSLFNGQCEFIGVRIRTVSNLFNADRSGIMWPNIPKTTLLFSNKRTYYSSDALTIDDYNFHKTVKPHYGLAFKKYW